MRIVVALAVAALVALIAALVTGSTLPAIAVVLFAGAGIVVLLRDWRTDAASDAASGSEAHAAASSISGSDSAGEASPDEPRAGDFSPDISTEPDGPSSDARADQI